MARDALGDRYLRTPDGEASSPQWLVMQHAGSVIKAF